ncbi:MAG: two pore domain potassium channel family protein [Sediminimonas qiaohouensis]|uniref:Two pore domain potassium channel family protein n=1 Tax=Sediminimonas qiaohouensis TaxID=552061 RepID=A0A7C9L7B6_9RHOB|nr:potassium channel family protein [Sediminimonas qiaohouensis]MTJ04115.1 two pore domain potassium channel family protein [Sediminimonas qiaohouensis]
MAKEGILIVSAVLALVLGVGTVFFHLVEGWSWLDAYFFTVITVSTVGYGSLVPATALGKFGTTILIFVGLGVFGAAIQQFSRLTYEARLKRRRKLRDAIAANVAEEAASDAASGTGTTSELSE